MAATSSYTAATQTATFTVNKGAPTIALTPAVNPSALQSSVTLTATLSSSALTAPTGTVTFMQGSATLGTGTIANGRATYTTSNLPAGTDPITAVYSGDANFVTVTSPTLTETVESLSLATSTGGTTIQTVSPGGTATYTFSVAPTGGSTFLDPVSFTVSGLPAGANYTISPQTIAAGSGTTTVTLTIQVSSDRRAGATQLAWPLHGRSVVSRAGASTAAFRWSGKEIRQAKRHALLLGPAVNAGLGNLPRGLWRRFGGGGNSATSQQPQNYNITVTGTSGSLTTATTVTLTVQ